MKTKYSEGDVMDYANTGAAISSGDVVALGNRIGIAVTDIAATTGLGAVALTGAHTLAKTVGEVYNQGDSVYWNSTTSKLTEVDTGLYAGTIIVAAAAAGTTAIVALADPGPGAASTAGKRLIYSQEFIGGGITLTDGGGLITIGGTDVVITDTSAAGAPTYTGINVHGGGLKCTLAADDEAENVCAYQGDILTFDQAQGLIAEFVLKVDAVPVANNILTLGLASARNDTPETITEHVSFSMSGSGALLVSWDDGTTDLDDGDPGVTWVAAQEKTLRLDFTDTAAVKVFIDGVDVTATVIAGATGPPTAIDVSAAATGLYQWFLQLQKTGGAGVTAATLKKVSIWADA